MSRGDLSSSQAFAMTGTFSLLAEPQKWEESLFRKLLEAAPDAIVIVRAAGDIVLVNGQAEKLFGYVREEMIGQKLEMLVPTRYRERHLTDRERYTRHPETRPMGVGLELYALRKDGTEIPVEISLSPLQLEDELLITSTVRDITAQKRASEELRRLNAELTAINRELEAFTYSVSHDLRAPVRHIESFSRILQEQSEADLSEPSRHCLRRIRESTRAMGGLIDGLLSLARLGRKELQLEITGLGFLVDEVRRELASDMDGRNIEWKVGSLPFVECDALLVKQIFANLLANAIKFTRPREKAMIEVGASNTAHGCAVFVRDNGVGFSMKYVGKLFSVFQRLHRVQEFEGTGVGLAIVQRIVHKHGGRVWAEAELNSGATFYFTLAGMNNGPNESAE